MRPAQDQPTAAIVRPSGMPSPSTASSASTSSGSNIRPDPFFSSAIACSADQAAL